MNTLLKINISTHSFFSIYIYIYIYIFNQKCSYCLLGEILTKTDIVHFPLKFTLLKSSKASSKHREIIKKNKKNIIKIILKEICSLGRQSMTKSINIASLPISIPSKRLELDNKEGKKHHLNSRTPQIKSDWEVMIATEIFEIILLPMNLERLSS